MPGLCAPIGVAGHGASEQGHGGALIGPGPMRQATWLEGTGLGRAGRQPTGQQCNPLDAFGRTLRRDRTGRWLQL